MSEGIPAVRRAAERLLLRSVRANVRRAVPGSVVLDGYALDWTERAKRGPMARCAHIDGQAVLELLADDLEQQ